MEDQKEEIVSNIPLPHNEICKDCLKWSKFGEACFVHWKGKKHCTQRVLTAEDWAEEANFR